MFFPKLEHLCKYPGMTQYVVNKLDEWLASQSEMYTDYLNPLQFIEDCKINKKLGLNAFALSSSNEFFEKENLSPILKIKYILDCPFCNENVSTYYDRNDIPTFELDCIEENCGSFIPVSYPEKINIYFELLDSPLIKEDDILSIFEKKPVPPLTVADDVIHSNNELQDYFWKVEEGKVKY